ncbi:MAG: T9SS type A sorting domain-containing protein [Bacteroidia bacterium]|nr:T9SS type A sorting domain-containing protein [Bacteroidia bacterium]
MVQADVWIVEINETGGIVWQKNFGSSSYDGGRCILEIAPEEYIVASIAGTADYDVSANYNSSDIWVFTLKKSNSIVEIKNKPGLYAYPNPFSETTKIFLSDAPKERLILKIYNQQGILVKQEEVLSQNTIIVNRSGLISGVYMLNLNGNDFNIALKLIIY